MGIQSQVFTTTAAFLGADAQSEERVAVCLQQQDRDAVLLQQTADIQDRLLRFETASPALVRVDT